MLGLGGDDTSGAAGAVAEPNEMSAAISELRKYYIMLGNPDISSTVAAPAPPGATPPEPPFPPPLPPPFGPEPEPPPEPPPPKVTGKHIENIMYITMDNTEGAYFAADLVTSDKLKAFFSISDDAGSPI